MQVGAGLALNDGKVATSPASSAYIKSGSAQNLPLTPYRQHESTFYGLAKAAGDSTQANSNNAVGTYTDDAKSAIKSMLGFLTDTDYATDQAAGIVRVNNAYGIAIAQNGLLSIDPATSTEIKSGTTLKPLVPIKQHASVFYGLAKAAGDTTQASSDNAVGTYTDEAKVAIKSMLDIPDGSDYVTKDSVNNAGITGRTYTDLFNGEFSVTTATTSGYLKPYARASVTGRFNKENMHRVTFNGTEYILKTRMWYDASSSTLKVFEYLGNLSYYIDDVSGVPGGTDSNVPFLIISDLNNNSSIDVLTNTVGTYTIKIEKITETKKQIPSSLLYNNYYEPILKNDSGGSTYNGFSIGVNELMSKRGTLALGYGNKISDAFSQAFGTRNIISENNSFAFGDKNIINGVYSLAFGQNINIESGTDVGIGFGYGTKVNCNNMVAMGKLNCIANTTFPNWANGTAYKKGDMVVADYGPATGLTWLCTVPHTSAASGTFMQDCQARYQETGSMGWTMAPSNGDVAFVIGNGQSENLRSNAMKLDFAGNGFFGGSIYVDCDADSTNGIKLATVDDVPDVQINGTSIVNSGVANIPIATSSTPGLVKTNANYGTYMRSNDPSVIAVAFASDTGIKGGENNSTALNPFKQHAAAFYGLAKAAGDTTQSTSSNAVGTYTDTAKTAIKSMLGVPNNAYDLNKGTALPANADLNDYITPGVYCADNTTVSTIENSPTTSEFKMIIEKINEDYGKQIVITYGGKHYERIFSILDGGLFLDWEKVIKDSDYATSSTGGIVKVDATNGIGIESQNKLYINYAPSDLIKSGTGSYRPICPPKQHESVFYGLAKAAGDTTQSSSSNTVGTYTDEAKTAIRNMLGISSGGGGGTGAVDDVQVNGTSIVSGGIANIPYASSSNVGLVRVSNTFGTYIDPNYPEYIRIYRADAADIKAGANGSNYALYRPITPQVQKNAVFYGLAQAASDTTQSSSSNSVGEYTEEAKIAIRKMLGIYEAPWELIRHDTGTNDTEADVTIDVDGNGESFELTDVRILFWLPTQSTAAGKGDYGRIYTYYDSSNADVAYAGQWTQASGATGKICGAEILQDGGMIHISVYKSVILSAEAYEMSTIRAYPYSPQNSQIWTLAASKRLYSRIKITKVTGSYGYVVYGKRNWS